MDYITSAIRPHLWQWDLEGKSYECEVSNDRLDVCFHPECSESAAAIRGSKPLIRNGNIYYWEVKVLDKVYGTSVMFGLCTKSQLLHANEYCNLVGLDNQGWSLSHKGFLWHNGLRSPFTDLFPQNTPVTVGLLFNTRLGELSYYLNGKSLGVAFYGLNNVKEELYPVVGSTAKCTRIRLLKANCDFNTLFERSCFTFLTNARDKEEVLNYCQRYRIPRSIVAYLAQGAEVCSRQTETTAQSMQY